MEDLILNIQKLQVTKPGEFQLAQKYLEDFVEANLNQWSSFYELLVDDQKPQMVKFWVISFALPTIAKKITSDVFCNAFF